MMEGVKTEQFTIYRHRAPDGTELWGVTLMLPDLPTQAVYDFERASDAYDWVLDMQAMHREAGSQEDRSRSHGQNT